MITQKRIKHHFQSLNLTESRFTRAIHSFVLVSAKSRVETFKVSLLRSLEPSTNKYLYLFIATRARWTALAWWLRANVHRDASRVIKFYVSLFRQWFLCDFYIPIYEGGRNIIFSPEKYITHSVFFRSRKWFILFFINFVIFLLKSRCTIYLYVLLELSNFKSVSALYVHYMFTSLFKDVLLLLLLLFSFSSLRLISGCFLATRRETSKSGCFFL